MSAPAVVRRPCPNVTTGRGGHAVDMVVIHVTEGSASSVRSWFGSKVSQVSAHYLVTVDGTVEQFVDEADTAWHAGRVDHPTAPLVLARPHVNPNQYSIGIEHEGTGRDPLTPPQLAASVALVQGICARHGIPIDRTHVVGHHEVYSLKTCPGAIDVNALVRAAAAPAQRSTDAPTVVWSAYLNDWLIVTRVVSDREWYFVRLGDAARLTTTKSSNPLSAMPRTAA